MSEFLTSVLKKSSPPPKNPPLEKSAAAAKYISAVAAGNGKGDSKGEREEPATIYMLLRCRQCGKVQQLIFRYWRPPEWHRCIGCGDLQPTQGYAMIMFYDSPLG